MSKYMCIRLICAIYKHKDIPLTLDCAASQSDCFYLGVARETAPGSAAPATASARQTARIHPGKVPENSTGTSVSENSLADDT